MNIKHISSAISQAAALALATSAAFGASTVEVTSGNSPYSLSADVTDVTTLSIAENCVLDLNGHDLAYNSPYGSGLNGLSGHACVITNSAASSTSTISFILNSDASAFGDILSKVSFGGNLKVVVKGHSSDKTVFVKDMNAHTGGTTLDSFNSKTADAGALDPNTYGRLQGATPLGTGPFTMKNGSRILVMDGNGSVMKWDRLAVENDAGNSAMNVLWLENRIVYSNAVDVAEGATLAIVSRNSYSQWASDFSGVRGTFALYDHGGTGGFVDEGTTGFPNAKVKFLDSTGTFQLRFKRDANGVIEIGELSTDDAIAAPAPNAIIYNIVNYTTQTLKIGGLGTDSTFYGNISKNSNAYLALEKVGSGTLVLGGTNTYVGATTLSGGALKLIGAGVIGDGSTANIVFNGGTLAFGDGDDAPLFNDYSARVKDSAKAVSVDTGAGDVTWANGLAASNVGGLVKLGEGTLDVAGYSSYTGDTIVSNGTLKVSFEYNGTREGFAASRTFAVEDGATLEATLRNTTATRPAADILSAFPARAVVNIDASDVNKGYPRWTDVSTSGFNGTVNFVSANALTTAGGFVAGASTFGSRDIAWGVTGAPDALTRVIDFEYNADANVNLGSFNWPSENAGIFIKRSGKFNIGGRDEPSVMNGRFLTYGGVTLTVNHANDATLSLGSGFGAQLADGQSGNDPALVINMQKGTLVNDADLSGHTVNLSSGVTLAGGPNGVWPASTALPASYAIAANTVSTTCLNGLSVDFAHGATLDLDLTGFDAADTSKVYTLLSADAIAALPSASLLNGVNATLKGSKWLFSVRKDGDGASLVLKWAPTGTFLVFR